MVLRTTTNHENNLEMDEQRPAMPWVMVSISRVY